MLFVLPAQVARGTVNGGVFKVGTGTIKDGIPDSTVLVNQLESVIEWGGIGEGGWGGIDTTSSESLSFSQASGLSNSAVLNRIMSGNTTQFDGVLNGADMRIFIVNPAGVIFGDGATINVSQLVASGLGMTNDAFHAVVSDVTSKMVFSGGTGDVTIEGTLDATATDSVYLVGRNVANNGAILCPDGLVVMAAGDEVHLGQPGSDVIVTIADLIADSDNLVDNNGTVGTGDEPVEKLVLAAGDVWSQAISNVRKVKIAAVKSTDLSDISAYAEAASDAVAEVDIEVGGDFTVDYEIMAKAEAEGSGNNSTANVKIDAGGDVDINAYVQAYAKTNEGAGNATAKTTVTAANVTLDDSGGIGADAYAEAGSGDATATVDITTTSSEVLVDNNSWIWSYAEASDDSGEATAEITVDADSVTVDNHSGIYAETEAYRGSGNTTATLDIDATGNVLVNGGRVGPSYIGSDAYSDDAGNATAETTVNAANVTVSNQGEIYAKADAYYDVTATATVDITANDGSVLVYGFESHAGINAQAYNGMDNTSNVTITAKDETGEDSDNGSVKVIAENYGDTWIYAEARYAENNNTANVLLCTDGDVRVEGALGGGARILAEAIEAYSNTAAIGIGAKGDEGVDVRAVSDGSAFIETLAQYGYTNTAETIVCTQGGVQVIDLGGERPQTAGITAKALSGHTNDAYVGVCAVDDVIVAAGIDLDELEDDGGTPLGMGGTAMIRAEAGESEGQNFVTANDSSGDNDVPEETSSANAEVVVVSKEGGVGVIDFTGQGIGKAEITAGAHNAYSNTANVGVAAGTDIVGIPDELPTEMEPVVPGSVTVWGNGPESYAGVYALARWGFENTADTVVCAPGEVVVQSDWDGWSTGVGAVAWGEEGDNTATTQVYASDVTVSEGAYIGAIVPGDSKFVTEWLLGDPLPIWEDDLGATLIIDDYSMAKDCPDCPPCPCEEEEFVPPVEPAPIGALAPIPGVQEILFEEGGCVSLMIWLSNELGVGVDVQVFVANAFAYSTDCQPCEIAARLKDAATILRDEDGSRMAAMNQVFNELAPADAPFTPEMAASIVTAFAGHVNDGTQYATAIEYIDAFVQYIAIVNNEMGSPVSDPVAYVMNKYGTGLTESENNNIAAFVATRLEGGETFGN